MNAHAHPIGGRPWRTADDLVCTASVARTIDEILQAVAVRSAVYMAEQRCPYAEEFDGNDFAGATHLIARIGDEPVGCLRIRWFADFLKIERVAVLPDYRGAPAARVLITAAITLGARKGYRRLNGHVTPGLVAYWNRQAGAKPRSGRPPFRFSGVDYVEMELDLPAVPDALDMDSDPLVLLRPEGDWDRPGVLERSRTDAGQDQKVA
jgi:predicted GNAT family N-acyltransferase